MILVTNQVTNQVILGNLGESCLPLHCSFQQLMAAADGSGGL
jgi:hypothetical protein